MALNCHINHNEKQNVWQTAQVLNGCIRTPFLLYPEANCIKCEARMILLQTEHRISVPITIKVLQLDSVNFRAKVPPRRWFFCHRSWFYRVILTYPQQTAIWLRNFWTNLLEHSLAHVRWQAVLYQNKLSKQIKTFFGWGGGGLCENSKKGCECSHYLYHYQASGNSRSTIHTELIIRSFLTPAPPDIHNCHYPTTIMNTAVKSLCLSNLQLEAREKGILEKLPMAPFWGMTRTMNLDWRTTLGNGSTLPTGRNLSGERSPKPKRMEL